MKMIFKTHLMISLFVFLFIGQAMAIDVPSSERCDRLLAEVIKETYYDEDAAGIIRSGFQKLVQVKTELLIGSEVPRWQDVESLKEILSQFATVDRQYIFVNEKSRKDFYNRVFGELVRDDESAKSFLEIKGEEIKTRGMSNPQIELMVYYRTVLEHVNGYLPTDFRLSLPKFTLDKYFEDLTNKAVEIVDNQKKLFTDLIETAGYKTFTDYQNAVTAGKSELGEDLVEMIRKEKLAISMQRPINARWWAPKVGLHNQHVTGSSRGYTGQEGRNAVEATMTGMKYDEYANLDNDIKPKYGSIRPEVESEVKPVLTWYGDDIYIMDLDKIRDRLTWTPGDSLNRVASFNSSWSSGVATAPEDWDNLFLPWDFRELTIPLFSQQFKEYNQLAIDYSNQYTFGSLKSRYSYAQANYLEIQIWGPLKLDHVKEFIFTTQEPEGEFLDELLARGIKIYDGVNKHPPVPWTPPKVEASEVEKVEVNTKRP